MASDASVVLYVNERLDPATIDGAVFLSQDGVVVPGSLAVTGNGRSVELTPDQPWAANALVQVFVTPDARDVAGNPLNRYEGSFRAAADPSASAPTVVRAQPSSGATGLPLNARLEVEYSEPLDVATVTAAAMTLRQSSTGQVVASTVSLERGGRVVRLTPNAPLAPAAQAA